MFSGLTTASATVISIPGFAATIFGFSYGSSKVLSALGDARVIPAAFSIRTRSTEHPIGATVGGSIMSFLLCLLCYYLPYWNTVLQSVSISFAMLGYLAQINAYLMLYVNFGGLERKYNSPIGLSGAVYSFIVWALVLIGTPSYQGADADLTPLLTCATLLLLVSVPYFGYYSHQQTLTKTELSVMKMINRISGTNLPVVLS